MKCARNKTTCTRSVELFVDVHVVKRHAIVDVLCRPVVNVVIGVHIVVLFFPHVVVHFVVLILLVVILYQFIPLFSHSHFSHMFSLYSHGILGVVFTGALRGQPTPFVSGHASFDAFLAGLGQKKKDVGFVGTFDTNDSITCTTSVSNLSCDKNVCWATVEAVWNAPMRP